MLAKNLNNAYFRENVENDDVQNTGFNMFLFKGRLYNQLEQKIK